MGHLRLTIGYLKATVVHIRVTLGHLKVNIGYFFLSANISNKANTTELHPKVRPTCYIWNIILQKKGQKLNSELGNTQVVLLLRL